MEGRKKRSAAERRLSFVCSHCAKRFGRHEHVQRHERLHTREKPFRCAHCPLAYTRRDLLVRHMKSAHGNKGSISSPFRNFVLDPNSFHKNKQCAPHPQHKQSGRPSTDADAVVSTATIPDDQIGAGTNLFSSVVLNHSPGAVMDVADEPFFGIDNLMPFDFSIDSFTEFLPEYLSPMPLHLGREDDTVSVLTTNLQSQQQTRSFRSWADSLTTVKDISVSHSTGRRLYWTFAEDEWLSFNTKICSYVNTSRPLPLSRQNMSRYVAAYFRNFHENLPFLHAPTINLEDAEVHLVLAIVTVGAQYCLELKVAASLFALAKAIIVERIQACRKTRRPRASVNTHLSTYRPAEASEREDPIQICQTLLLLMAAATWGDFGSMAKEDLHLRDTLAIFMREENLLAIARPSSPSWREWIRAEGARRTVLIVCCFFNFHTILYNVPSPVLNPEIHMQLPCDEEEWRCSTAASWEDMNQRKTPSQPDFQEAFSGLLQHSSTAAPRPCSSLGIYILISAIIQRIYLMRQFGKTLADYDNDTYPMEADRLYQALTLWQQLWEMDPYRCAAPGNTYGPLPFNSTAQFRMAYIRLSMDIGSCFTLESHDAEQVAVEMTRSPTISRNRYSTKAALQAAHTLSTPVKIGIKVVARTQALTWSLQHSLSYLESAFLLSKWLDMIAAAKTSHTGTPPNEEESQVLEYVQGMLDECEAEDEVDTGVSLSVRLVNIWASLLSQESIWPIVGLVGTILTSYANLLAESPSQL